ncbi:MAG: MBOAT family protein [Clostridium sp.]|uniref:MBOAT family O-acyltransferase n=1 Tax=Clostridium sp. TaxID=1506 RepID=UPI003216B6E6
MVFTSTIFMFVFLPAIITTYFLIPEKYRNILLLLASLFFYAWGEPKHIVVMLISILINYYFGYKVHENAENSKKKRNSLILAIIANLSMLMFFKYGNFIVNNINNILGLVRVNQQININPIHLPIGISFFTFQGLSYVLDVYKNEAKVQKNIYNLALYISLFPQLIAGPIVRYQDVADEIEKREVTTEKFAAGIKRFVIGFAKKILIANQLGLVADKIFSIEIAGVPTSVAWLGVICYTMQIYYDFSGYSDMAIGLGKIFGFTFLENFNFPYISKSITEFWRRWHISLTTWFRDYVYIPLGGNRKGQARSYINLFIVFLLSGLWHGASWNFVFWGVYNGGFLALEKAGFGKVLNKLWKPLRHIYTMVIVMVGWVFFRIEDMGNAVEYLKHMFIYEAPTNLHYMNLYINPKIILVLIMAVILSAPILKYMKSGIYKVIGDKVVYNVATNVGIMALLIICLIVLAGSTYNPFIYFRF